MDTTYTYVGKKFPYEVMSTMFACGKAEAVVACLLIKSVIISKATQWDQ